jgi:hypothetical protein
MGSVLVCGKNVRKTTGQTTRARSHDMMTCVRVTCACDMYMCMYMVHGTWNMEHGTWTWTWCHVMYVQRGTSLRHCALVCAFRYLCVTSYRVRPET